MDAKDWNIALRRALTRETLTSVRLRAKILAALIVFGLALFLVVVCVPALTRPALHEKFRDVAPPLVALIALALAYEATVVAVVSRWLAVRREPHRAWAYASSAVEITFPTLAMLIFARRLDALSALSAASNAFYLVFVLFAILRMDFGLCAFTGVLAGAQYAAAALYVLAAHPVPPGVTDLAAAPVHHVVIGALFAAAGLVAAFVSLRIQRQIAASIRHVEDRNRVIGLFGQHVSPAVVEKLLSQQVEFEGETRHVCVMFLDIRDFTPFADARQPEEVMRYLNRLFTSMIETVNRHRGIVNKFLGDGFMAVFGAPLDDGDNCRHAVDASLEILGLLDEMNRRGDIPPTRVGIGLHAGHAVTGNLGSPSRKEYAIIGSVVNTAARIEQLNKQFQSRLLVSAAVRDACANDLPSPDDLGDVPIKGQVAPLRLFKVA
jgi:adenylate cyclase